MRSTWMPSKPDSNEMQNAQIFVCLACCECEPSDDTMIPA
jgi:hypothetical protein